MGKKNRQGGGGKSMVPSGIESVSSVPMNDRMDNSLAEGIGFGSFNAFNFPQSSGFPGTEPLSGATPLFKNLRWYLVSNFRQLLSELYVEIGLVQTIVDVPVDDALRGGVDVKSKQLDEDQLLELQTALDRDDDLVTVGQASKWQRLFGGAGILIITDQDPEIPLNVDAITADTSLEFRAVDMWELFWSMQNTEGYDPSIQTEIFEYYDYYGEKVHKSRVMPLKGFTAPSFIRPRLRGWGFSVVEVLVRSINQYLKATDLGYEVLDEFKLDVYKIKNLVNTLLSPNGKQKIQQRVQLANWQKNYQNAVVMDSEDEFDHKQLSFAGLAEAMAGIRMQVAADLRMPLTKLFGISAAGFNSGEDDIEVYNAMVESQVRLKLKKPILKLIEIKCQQLFGFIPDDLTIAFKPLRVLSSEQEETVKTNKFNRLLSAKQAGEITRFEFRDGCNKDNLLPVSLDTAGDKLNPDDPEIEDVLSGDDADEEGNPDGGDDVENPKGKKPKQSTTKVKDAPAAKNAIVVLPRPYTSMQRFRRSLQNSLAFDKACYAAEGGDGWVHQGKRELFENPRGVDKSLWNKAKAASIEAFGKEKWQFVTWFYKKHGGKFNG